MDHSFEVFSGHKLNACSREATRSRVNWICNQASGRVLDVGCSQGLIPWLLGHKGLKITGIDLDEESIAWGLEKLKDADPEAQKNINLICSDFLSFSPDEKFDTITAGEYLEHLEDAKLDAHLAHMAKLLEKDGRLVITVPLGLHPHPDHEQIFLPQNFTEKLGRHFSITQMDVEDGYLRCICDLTMPRQAPAAAQLLELSERGLVQIQRKAQAGKRAVKVAELKSLGHDLIAPYLREKRDGATANPLAAKLSAKGLYAPFIYDRYLFKTLNEIYADHPLVPQPREISAPALFAQADHRVDYLAKHFSPAGKYCLEIGCGRGETSVRLAERANCTVIGVDANSYPEWQERENDKVSFMEVDLTSQTPFDPESFDFIFSFAVLEHVRHPLTMLDAIYALLKPGGDVYFTANLYRGPMASHRYREVYFPWPHLLFDDETFMRFYSDRDGRKGVTPAWVNKLTHLHYLDKVKSLGFEIKRCSYSRRPFDDDFYQVFEEKLGKYPKEDLELDFINLMLYKPARTL